MAAIAERKFSYMITDSNFTNLEFVILYFNQPMGVAAPRRACEKLMEDFSFVLLKLMV